MQTERGRIAQTGMGGFLNPPTHPEHTQSVETGPARDPNGGYSLSSAAECEWLDQDTRSKARAILDAWKAPAIDSPEVQEWVLKTLGYFRNCYKGHNGDYSQDAPENWHAEHLRILQDTDPMLNLDIHAGVHHIRKWYPDFVPTAEHFQNAYWGTKPG